MCRLLETIKVYDGSLFGIKYHNERMNNSREKLFGATTQINLSEVIIIPNELKTGMIKCRVTYDNEIQKVEFENYVLKKIEKLVLIYDNDIEYNYKYAERKKFEEYSRINYSAEPLFIKAGRITDTTYANVALFDGKDYFTPALPLLRGTKREYLLNENIIKEKDILAGDIKNYISVFLINAMIDLEDKIEIPIKNIVERMERL